MNQYPFRLRLPEGDIEAYIEAPDGPLRLMDLAGQLLDLSSTVAGLGAAAAERNGFSVSCSPGCGACCRQLVPLSPPEAALIHALVEGLPEPRRGEIKQQFARAEERLAEAALLDRLGDPADPLLAGSQQDYFGLAIPCPFLENESCGIYEQRPSRCREYLVVTPAERCADLYRQSVARLPVSIRLNEALTWLWAAMTGQKPAMVPLTRALSWSEAQGQTRHVASDAKAMLEYVTRDIQIIADNIERDELQRRGKDAAVDDATDAGC